MYGIKATYYYYGKTYNAPSDGFLREEDNSILKFSTIPDALEYLENRYGRMELEKGKATYSAVGTYVLRHGEYSRPRYTITKLPSTMHGRKVSVKRCRR